MPCTRLLSKTAATAIVRNLTKVRYSAARRRAAVRADGARSAVERSGYKPKFYCVWQKVIYCCLKHVGEILKIKKKKHVHSVLKHTFRFPQSGAELTRARAHKSSIGIKYEDLSPG